MDDVNNIFEKEGTVAQPVSHIVRIIILQHAEDMVKSFEFFLSFDDNSGMKDKSKKKVISRIKSLLLWIKTRMYKRIEEDTKEWTKQFKEYFNSIEDFENAIKQGNFENPITIIMSYLEIDLKLTKIDTVQDYDRTNIINSNKMKGYK